MMILDLFFSFLSNSHLVIWTVIFIFLLLNKTRNKSKLLISLITSLIITSILVNFVLKPIFRQSRPNLTSFNCPTDYSFPSSHTAIAFAAATVLVFFDKKRRWLYWIVAILISLSRIYLGCHYFVDVVAGAIIGYLISNLTLTKRTLFF